LSALRLVGGGRSCRVGRTVENMSCIWTGVSQSTVNWLYSRIFFWSQNHVMRRTDSCFPALLSQPALPSRGEAMCVPLYLCTTRRVLHWSRPTCRYHHHNPTTITMSHAIHDLVQLQLQRANARLVSLLEFDITTSDIRAIRANADEIAAITALTKTYQGLVRDERARE
jgi:hypothetical protein